MKFPVALFMSFFIQSLYYTVDDGMSKAGRKGVRVNRLRAEAMTVVIGYSATISLRNALSCQNMNNNAQLKIRHLSLCMQLPCSQR